MWPSRLINQGPHRHLGSQPDCGWKLRFFPILITRGWPGRKSGNLWGLKSSPSAPVHLFQPPVSLYCLQCSAAFWLKPVPHSSPKCSSKTEDHSLASKMTLSVSCLMSLLQHSTKVSWSRCKISWPSRRSPLLLCLSHHCTQCEHSSSNFLQFTASTYWLV